MSSTDQQQDRPGGGPEHIPRLWSKALGAPVNSTGLSVHDVLAVAAGSSLQLVDIPGNFAIKHSVQNAATHTSVAFAAKGNTVIVGCSDGFLKWYQVESGEETCSTQFQYNASGDDDNHLRNGAGPQAVTSIVASKTSNRLAAASGRSICIFGIGGEHLHTIGPLAADVAGVAWLSDDVVAAAAGSAVQSWTVSEEECETGVTYATGSTGTVCSLAAAPKLGSIAAACSDGTVLVWKVQQTGGGAPVLPQHRFHEAGAPDSVPPVRSICWDAEGRLLATSSGHEAHIWDVAAAGQKPLSICAGQDTKELITCMAFQPGGRLLVCGTNKNSVVAFDSAMFRLTEATSPSSATSVSQFPCGSTTALVWTSKGVLAAASSTGDLAMLKPPPPPTPVKPPPKPVATPASAPTTRAAAAPPAGAATPSPAAETPPAPAAAASAATVAPVSTTPPPNAAPVASPPASVPAPTPATPSGPAPTTPLAPTTPPAVAGPPAAQPPIPAVAALAERPQLMTLPPMPSGPTAQEVAAAAIAATLAVAAATATATAAAPAMPAPRTVVPPSKPMSQPRPPKYEQQPNGSGGAHTLERSASNNSSGGINGGRGRGPPRDPREPREPPPREPPREPRENRDVREPRPEPRDPREMRDPREARDPRDMRAGPPMPGRGGRGGPPPGEGRGRPFWPDQHQPPPQQGPHMEHSQQQQQMMAGWQMMAPMHPAAMRAWPMPTHMHMMAYGQQMPGPAGMGGMPGGMPGGAMPYLAPAGPMGPNMPAAAPSSPGGYAKPAAPGSPVPSPVGKGAAPLHPAPGPLMPTAPTMYHPGSYMYPGYMGYQPMAYPAYPFQYYPTAYQQPPPGSMDPRFASRGSSITSLGGGDHHGPYGVPGMHGGGGMTHGTTTPSEARSEAGDSSVGGDDRLAASATLYVGNLGSGVTEAELAQHFTPYGPVSNVQVIRERGTNVSRGFGFVTYQDPKHAHNAMRNMHGTRLQGLFEGRQIKVSHSNRDPTLVRR